MDLPFAAQEGKGGVTQNSRETLINMYAEPVPSGRSLLLRRQRPGLSLSYPMSEFKRGIARFEHGHYIVARDGFYRWDGTTLSLLGKIDTNIGNVTMVSDDNDNVFLSDGAKGYHWDGETLTRVETPTAVGTCAWQSGFGIYTEPGTDRWYVSAMNDLSSWDALDFATAEYAADPNLRVFAEKDEIWFFGTRTTEVWRNSGSGDFPFVPNTSLERGCGAAFSVAADDNTLFWLGDDGIVYRADGYRPARISTHVIEGDIADVANMAAAEAFIYTSRGHKFYTLRFPGEFTLQYNIATGLWNRAKTWSRPDWRVIGGAGRGVDYYLDDNGIVTLDNGINTDSGQVMERIGISAPIHNDGNRFRIQAFWLDAEMGRVPVGKEPVVALQVSRNGEEFGNVLTRSSGKTGEYRRRAVWRGLGMARQFSLKFTMTDDAPFEVVSIKAEVA